MRITQLHLKNIGVFEDEILKFQKIQNIDKADIHILTGENGTGKSTILYALANMTNFFIETFKDYKVVNYLQESTIQKRFLNENSNYTIYFNTDNTKIEVSQSKLKKLSYEYSNEKLKDYHQKILNYSENTFNFAFFAYSGYRDTSSYQIKSIQEITENPFEDALDFHKSVNPQLLIQWIANTKTKEALALAKSDHTKAEKHRKALSRIEETISNIINQKIAFVLEDEPLNVVLQVDDKVLNFDVLPDGLKSILSWIADLLMRMDRISWATNVDVLDRDFILFLDEIEVHLHPAWQRKILPEIQKLFRNAQIFISTHSPFVVGSVDDAWVYRLKLDENGNAKVVEVTESKAGESIGLILDEVFGVEEEFDVETEKEFEQFYELRNQLFAGQLTDENLLYKKAQKLAEKSTEIKDIIGRELRQIEKIKQKAETV